MAKYFVKADLREFDEEGFTGFSETFQGIIDLDSSDIEDIGRFSEAIKLRAGVDNNFFVEVLMLVKLEV